MKTINKAFMIAFFLLGITSIATGIIYEAYHQFFLSLLCAFAVLVLRADNKKIDREGFEIVDFDNN